MGLSSNILWHQTNYRGLRNILKSKSFMCSYSLEEVDEIVGEKIAFPMVSMCDLPFSELSEYLGKYGDYAIGLTKEWGVKMKFNPIWYYEPKSRVPQILKKEITDAISNGDDSIFSLIGILSYMKKLEGPLPSHKYSLYRFYDEREVRFVPSAGYLASKGNEPMLTSADYKSYKLANGNSSINAVINFDWADVRYIIVKEDKQVPIFLKYLDRLGCNNKTIGVFSSKQINQDFIGYKHNRKDHVVTVVYPTSAMASNIKRLINSKKSGLIP